jgi:Tfp pilus assembly protein PilO
MMKSKIKYSRYIIATAAVWAVTVIVLGGGYFLFYAPQQAELFQLNYQCAESQTALEQAQLAAQDKTKAKQQQQCEDVDRLLSGLSTHQDTVTELVFEIGRIATNDLRLFEFSSKNQTQKNYPTVGQSELVSEVWLNVDFQATFDQFAQFLNRLERHDPVVFVEEVSFRRGTQDSLGHKVSLQLSFLTKTGAKNKKVAAATH